MTDEELTDLAQNRGSFGTAIEKYFFGISPGSYQGPDFKEAGVELKTTGIKKIRGEWKAKERLVLGMIAYNDIHLESFETSSLLKKSSLLLIMFYIYQKTDQEIDFIDYVIKMSRLFKFPDEDLKIIKEDWEKIVSKVKAGKAHELSEGDTFYLGACTKGRDNRDKTTQPFSDILAMRRAFSLKPRYLNLIINKNLDAEPILEKDELNRNETVESLLLQRFDPFKNLSVEEIAKKVGLGLNSRAKNYYSMLTMRMLGVRSSKALELEKADISVKTIRLNSSGTPKEAMSFPNFKYKEIVNQGWEESDLKSQLEKKFLFVIFQYNEAGNLLFKKAMFWNMPYLDLIEAEKVWLKTVEKIKSGDAVNLPKSAETYNVHVRPHAKNSIDTYQTPHGDYVVKKCFWLNISYIKDIVS